MEFTDVCRHFLGRTGEIASITFSLAALTGAAIVYWVLMSNFLYNSVKFVFGEELRTFTKKRTGHYIPMISCLEEITGNFEPSENNVFSNLSHDGIQKIHLVFCTP